MEAAALEDGVAGVGLDGRPDRVRAVVDQGQHHGIAIIRSCGESEERE